MNELTQPQKNVIIILLIMIIVAFILSLLNFYYLTQLMTAYNQHLTLYHA